MGYDVQVHRAADWVEAPERPIRRDEWEAWVSGAPDVDFDPSSYVTYANEERGEWIEVAAI